MSRTLRQSGALDWDADRDFSNCPFLEQWS